MLYNLFYPLAEHFSIFNVFRYITFRTGYAIVTSMLIMLIFGTMVTGLLQKWKLSQMTKGVEPARHKNKEGTPTMGGIIIVAASVISTIMWSDLSNKYVWIVLIVYTGFAVIGLADDYIKTIKQNPLGLPGKGKFIAQSVAALLGITLIVVTDKSSNMFSIMVPFFKNISLNMSWFYIFVAWFIIVGSSNAVNLTDGLDGLAIMPAVVSFGAFAILAYVAGNIIYADYLYIFYVRGASELAIFCGAMVGAGLGFLWFNAYPASIFMGDVGSLSIGGALGTVAVIVKQEVLLALIGGLFVMETLSVILQVGYFKITHGKRIFRMAPLHHHFELKGWSEPKIIVRFWIVSVIMAIVAMSTLKLR
ncbi:MAG: phospho-N-acetylmuramoyl-pentapeptide-transferase [Deferribacteraceae bacterium]|jgi:phospho-N-acetylmuramoyl-pentapeptide-transferase|nr:phospho-N-acetylmuramoyl-pentapeptide-transferase [Deferribacteraceae bacterium]